MKINKIIKIIKQLKQEPVSQAWLIKGEKSLRKFMNENLVRKSELIRHQLSKGFNELIFKPMPLAIISFIIILATGGGTALAAQAALPNDTLYPIKLATENIREVLTFDETKKMELQVKLAGSRLIELEKLHDKNIEVAEKTISDTFNKYENHLDKAQKYLDQLNNETENSKTTMVAIQLDKKIIVQQEKLEILATKVLPTSQFLVANAQKVALKTEIKSLEKIEDKIGKIETATESETTIGIKEIIPPTIKTEINEYVDNLEQKAENALNKVDNRRAEIRNRIDVFASQKDNRCSFEEKQEFLKKLEDKYQEMVDKYKEAKQLFSQGDYWSTIKKADEALIIAIDLDNFIGQWRRQCNITQPPIIIDDGGILIVGLNQKFELKINETTSLEKENIQITLTKIINCGIRAQLCFDKATFLITYYPLKIGRLPLTLAVNQTGEIRNNIYLTLLAVNENQVTLILNQKNTNIACTIPKCLYPVKTGETDNGRCPIYKCATQPPQDCPVYSPLAPDWCKGGEIIWSTIDENGCQKPPICKLPSEETESSKTPTEVESESNFFSPILKSLENILEKIK